MGLMDSQETQNREIYRALAHGRDGRGPRQKAKSLAVEALTTAQAKIAEEKARLLTRGDLTPDVLSALNQVDEQICRIKNHEPMFTALANNLKTQLKQGYEAYHLYCDEHDIRHKPEQHNLILAAGVLGVCLGVDSIIMTEFLVSTNMFPNPDIALPYGMGVAGVNLGLAFVNGFFCLRHMRNTTSWWIRLLAFLGCPSLVLINLWFLTVAAYARATHKVDDLTTMYVDNKWMIFLDDLGGIAILLLGLIMMAICTAEGYGGVKDRIPGHQQFFDGHVGNFLQQGKQSMKSVLEDITTDLKKGLKVATRLKSMLRNAESSFPKASAAYVNMQGKAIRAHERAKEAFFNKEACWKEYWERLGLNRGPLPPVSGAELNGALTIDKCETEQKTFTKKLALDREQIAQAEGRLQAAADESRRQVVQAFSLITQAQYGDGKEGTTNV